ncbi:cell filamentation protein Fic [Candidatus Poribacteria bacterium]|nr:MAG: cell filamentation protein Fic [Candidatus Poribacteria bacterium]
MNPENFRNSSAGNCIRSLGKHPYWCYVPNPLPPQIDLDWELANLLSEANIKLGELSGVAKLLPNPHLLIGPFIRREAVMSSRIENIQSGLDQLYLFEVDKTETPEMPDVQELANYVNAMEFGIKRMQKLPLSSRLLCEMHEVLMRGVRGEHATPGLMRISQNWIGSPGCTLMDATYVPPPVSEMKTCFSDLERYIHSNAKEPPLIQSALVHYHFEAIHPFVDGNGRIGRLLIILMLMEKEILSQPLLYISDYFERHRDTYYELLLNVSQQGDWNSWITFFLKGICEQSGDGLLTIQKILSLREQYRELITGTRVPRVVNRLIEHLFSTPLVSVSGLSKEWKEGFTTVQRGVDYLVEKDILKEMTGQRRNRLFIADEILNIIMTERAKSVPQIED